MSNSNPKHFSPKNPRILRRSSLENSTLLQGHICRRQEPPDFLLNPQSRQSFSYVLQSLWRPVDSAIVSGDLANIPMLVTIVINEGTPSLSLYTNKSGSLAKKDSANTTLAQIEKEWTASSSSSSLTGSPQPISRSNSPTNFTSISQGGDSYLDISSLPVAIIHKSNGEQQLVDSRQFCFMCQSNLSPDVIAVQRFVPPRGSNILKDENLTCRNVDTTIANYFFEYNFSENGQPQTKCFKSGMCDGE